MSFNGYIFFAFSERKYQQNSKTIYTTENVYFTNFLIYTYLMKHCLVVTEFEKNYEYCNYFIGPTRGLSNSKEQEKA